MNEELEKQLDKLAAILWCKKIERSDGSVAYMLPIGEGGHLVMTNRLKRLNTYMLQQGQVEHTEGFSEGNAEEVK